MKRLFMILTICGILTGQIFAVEQQVNKTEQAAQKFAEFLPKIINLLNEDPNAIELQLGFAALCSSNTLGSVCYDFPAVDEYDKVLVIDPNNKIAWANKARLICRQHTALRANLISTMQGMVENAKARNRKEVTIPRRSKFNKWFKPQVDKGNRTRDVETVVQELTELIDSNQPKILKVLQDGELVDPQNALYNYMRAHLYFEIGDDEKAIEQLKLGVEKPYWNNYQIETSIARSAVLYKIAFPSSERPEIDYRFTLHADFLRGEIWKKRLVPLIDEYEAKGDTMNAEQIYNIVIKLAQHIKTETLPFDSKFNQQLGTAIENWALERLDQNKKGE